MLAANVSGGVHVIILLLVLACLCGAVWAAFKRLWVAVAGLVALAIVIAAVFL